MTTAEDRGWAIRTVDPVGLHELIEAVCRAFNTTPPVMRGYERDDAHVVLARMVVCYLARELTTASFPRIGRTMQRDHTTIMTARTRLIAKLDDPHPRNDAIRAIVIRLRKELARGSEAND